MWKKPFKTRSSILKGSDRKKVKEGILKNFPDLPKESLDLLIPQKGDSVTVSKVLGSYIIIYSVDNEPVFFDVDSRNNYYPTGPCNLPRIEIARQTQTIFTNPFFKPTSPILTLLYPYNLQNEVYALWKLPVFLPTLVIHPATFKFIARGADLMLPGVAFPSGGLDLLYKKKAMVILSGSNIPVAVGHYASTVQVTNRAQMVGKALEVQHYHSDNLWASGSKTHPTVPDIHESNELLKSTTADQDDEDIAALEAAQTSAPDAPSSFDSEASSSLPPGLNINPSSSDTTPSQIHVGSEEGDSTEENTGNLKAITETSISGTEVDTHEVEESQITVEEMDALVSQSFLQALKRRLKEKDLPILASKFWAEFCLPCRPLNTQLNIKRTSWKKLLSFLEEQVRKGLICIRTSEKGVTAIVAIVRDHPDLVNFKTLPVSATMESLEALNANDQASDASKPIIQEYWSLHKKMEFLLVVEELESSDEESPMKHEEPLDNELETNLASSSQSEVASSSTPSFAQQLDLESLKGLKKGRYFTMTDITALLWSYVSLRELTKDVSNSKMVKLDLNLASSLFAGKKSVGDLVEKKDLAQKFKEKIIPLKVVSVNGETRVERGHGQIGSIKVIIEARGGSKVVTRIQGLHHFGLDLKAVSKKASKRFASSAGLGKDEKGHEELLLQGNLDKQVPEFLLQDFNIPSKYVEVEVKANVKKKKK